jgi:hypothetical protein
MLDRAILLYEKTLAGAQRILGTDHPDVIKSRDHLERARGEPWASLRIT